MKVLLTIIKKRYICPKKYDVVVLEYGIDKPWEMDFLLDIVKPHIWIFTKIDSVHSEQFGDPSEIANEESFMIQNTSDIAFLNSDDTYARQLYTMIEIDKFLYTTTNNDSGQLLVKPDIDYFDEKLSKDSEFIVSSNLKIVNNWKERKISTNLIWKESYWYISLAFAILDVIEYKFKREQKRKIGKKGEQEGISIEYKLIPWRSTILQWINESVILDSSYNASPLSMRKLIETINTMKFSVFSDCKVCLVLWDMRELWDFVEEEHRKVSLVASMVADTIVLVGKYTHCYMKDELEKIWYNGELKCFKNSIEAGEYLKKNTKKRLFLFKWSQNTIFLEEAVKFVLDPMKNNMRHFHYLVRQSKWWMEKKKKFFEGLREK